MDERRTLKLLAWTIGGLVGLMFLLNGVALSLVPPPGMTAHRHVPSERPTITTATLRIATNTRPRVGSVE